MKHLHLPLNEELHSALIREAQASGRAATSLVREAIERLLAERRQRALEAALDTYIQAESGGPNDLDEELEAHAAGHLLETPA